MSYDTLKLKYQGCVATITLNRPEKRNALSSRMIQDLLTAFDEVEAGPARILILTGAGKAFCSGADLESLRSLATQSAEENLEDSKQTAKMFYRLRTFPRPVIAAVNGAAVAGGCGIATLADFTLAVPEAKFGYPEVKIGFLPALVSVFLSRQVSEKIARDLLLSGRLIDSSEAQRLGLVTEIVAAEKLLRRAQELVDTLLAASPTSLERTKRLLSIFEDDAIRRELALAAEANAEIRSTDDFREGLSAFLEKRAPRWTGC